MVHHEFDQLLECGLIGIPAKLFLCLCWVTPKVNHICRTVEVFADLDQRLANQLLRAFHANAFLVDSLTLELEFYADMTESEVCKLANRMLNTCCNHKVFRGFVLKDEPHTFHIILGITPVAKAVEVAQIESVLLALGNSSCGKSDLTRHKSLASTLAFVVEENA